MVIEEGKHNATIGVGSHVTIQEADSPEETYHLVGPTEADPRNGKISHESPLGKEFLGKQVGDDVQVNLPAGPKKYLIKAIQ